VLVALTAWGEPPDSSPAAECLAEKLYNSWKHGAWLVCNVDEIREFPTKNEALAWCARHGALVDLASG
jgi:hypothetical protein